MRKHTIMVCAIAVLLAIGAYHARPPSDAIQVAAVVLVDDRPAIGIPDDGTPIPWSPIQPAFYVSDAQFGDMDMQPATARTMMNTQLGTTRAPSSCKNMDGAHRARDAS